MEYKSLHESVLLFIDYAALFQVMQFLESPEYAKFTRIVFDTAPTVCNIDQLLNNVHNLEK